MGSLVFWQNIPSIHQAPLVREVAKRWSGPVWMVAEADLSSVRVLQGWVRPDFFPANLLVAPTRRERMRLLRQSGSRFDIHIFSGFHAYPDTCWTMQQAAKTQASLGVFAEPGRHNDGIWALLRRIKYIQEMLKWRKRLNFILATGDLGVKWYSSCFFPEDKIFSFGYFVERCSSPVGQVSSNDSFSLLFVGQLIARKGIDILLRALASLHELDWVLQIIGDGPLRQSLNALACRLGIADRIIWRKVLANDMVKREMAASDLLVLPSYYDGWGAVVNEALMVGTPVVVSDACGASDLVQFPRLGGIFHAGSVGSLKMAILKQINRGRAVGERAYIQNWATNCIEPRVAAAYLVDIILAPEMRKKQVVPPWRNV